MILPWKLNVTQNVQIETVSSYRMKNFAPPPPMCFHVINGYIQTMIPTNFKPDPQIHIQCSFNLYENENDRYHSSENTDKFRELFECPSYVVKISRPFPSPTQTILTSPNDLKWSISVNMIVYPANPNMLD